MTFYLPSQTGSITKSIAKSDISRGEKRIVLKDKID